MNRDEYLQRAREHAPRGSALPWAKSTEAQVREDRETYERAQYAIAYINANYSISALAAKRGISDSAMSKRLRYETWGHV